MRHFWFHQRGNVAVLFALAIVPIVGGIGAAVDYSMASAYRTDMQKSLDAAGISLAKIMPASQATLDEKGKQFFDANMGTNSLSNIVLTIVPDIATGSLTLTATGLYKPQIAGIIGISEFQIGTDTTVNWARTKLEVALAFDLSSSMASASGGVSKVDVAKEAAGELVDTLFAAVSNDDPERLKISVVPYTSTVNIGTEHKNAAWMDQSGVSSAHWAPSGTGTVGGNITKPAGATSRFTLFTWLNESWQGCVATRPGALGLNDDAPVSGTPNSLFVPYFFLRRTSPARRTRGYTATSTCGGLTIATIRPSTPISMTRMKAGSLAATCQRLPVRPIGRQYKSEAASIKSAVALRKRNSMSITGVSGPVRTSCAIQTRCCG